MFHAKVRVVANKAADLPETSTPHSDTDRKKPTHPKPKPPTVAGTHRTAQLKIQPSTTSRPNTPEPLSRPSEAPQRSALATADKTGLIGAVGGPRLLMTTSCPIPIWMGSARVSSKWGEPKADSQELRDLRDRIQDDPNIRVSLFHLSLIRIKSEDDVDMLSVSKKSNSTRVGRKVSWANASSAEHFSLEFSSGDSDEKARAVADPNILPSHYTPIVTRRSTLDLSRRRYSQLTE